MTNIEAEINPVDINDLLVELKTIKGLQVEVLQGGKLTKIPCDDENGVATDFQKVEVYFAADETQDQSDSESDTNVEPIEPIVEPNSYSEEDKAFQDIFEDNPIDEANSYSEEDKAFQDIFEDNPIAEEPIKSPIIREVSVSLRKSDKDLVDRYVNTRKPQFKVKLLQNIIDIQDRSQKYPNAKEPIELPEGTFMCHQCYNSYKDKRSVIKHIREFHRKSKHQEFKCEQCDKSFTTQDNLSSHFLQIHSKIFRYTCSKCSEFKTHKRLALVQHLKEIHQVPESEMESMIKSNYRVKNRAIGSWHQCSRCEFTTKHKCHLKLHMNRKHKIEAVQSDPSCKLCKKEFLGQQGLNNHLCPVRLKINERFSNATDLQCPGCNQTFDEMESLKKHYIEYHGETSPEALACHKKLKQGSSTTENSDSLLCDQCPFIADGVELLQKHVRKVHQQNKLSCQVCLFSTNSMENLTNHISKKHSHEPSHLCTKCPLVFMTKEELRQHLQRSHFEEFKTFLCKAENCDYFNMKARDRELHYITKHVKEKRFMCDQCDYRAFIPAEIQRHIRQKHYGIYPWNCHLCHAENLQMGFPTHKEFHRHLHWQHGIQDPKTEETIANMEVIKNPPALGVASMKERKDILIQSRKSSGIHVPRKSRKRKHNSKAMQKKFKKLCAKIELPNTE